MGADVSEHRVQQLMDLAHDCVMELGLDGCVLTVNRRGAAMMGLSRGDIEGRPWLDVWPKEHRVAAADALSFACGGRATRFIASTVGSDETQRWWSVSVGPLTDHDGAIAAVGAVSREVTERVRLEASLEAINAAVTERLVAANRSIAKGGRREAGLSEDLARAERAVVVSDRANALLRDRLDLATMAQPRPSA